MSSQLVTVVTTIQRPTPSMLSWSDMLLKWDASLVAIGDAKGPDEFQLPAATFYSLERQRQLPFALAERLPTGHYARKNIGYLLAMQQRPQCIYETDDDNMPLPGWRPRSFSVEAQPVRSREWINVYRLWNGELSWPRGFPLNRVGDPTTWEHDQSTPAETIEAPIQQGLADVSPDVDAVWRLLLDREFRFGESAAVALPRHTWCPFNSQNTWWWPPAWPLMYLPATCSFRMTDIWRSFVAQRCLWELDARLVFYSPDVSQERNEHNLMQDFRDEIPGYLQNEALVGMLDATPLKAGPQAISENVRRCYEVLVEGGLVREEELDLLDAWLLDIASVLASDQYSEAS